MASAELLPLALLFVDGGRPVEGITRFQKLVFLAQKEEDVNNVYDFYSDKYGPFSSELYNALDDFEERDLVRQETEYTRGGNEKHVYSLTDYGRKVMRKARENNKYDDVFEAAQNIKRQHNDTPLDRLLRIVYNRYPDYTDESELDI